MTSVDWIMAASASRLENRSDRVTSLQPLITCSYYVVSKRRIERRRARYFVRELDRQLLPDKPVCFSATPENLQDELFGFSWFRTYAFLPSRGHGARMRVRNALLAPLSELRFNIELARLKVFGKVRADPQPTTNQTIELPMASPP
jgi:hypothetical protein